MEIHSSSLAFYPTSANRSATGQANNAKLTTDKELNSNEPAQQNATSQPRNIVVSSSQLEQQLDWLKPVSLIAENFPANTRILKALNAYTETINQPLQEHRSQLAGVDFYV